MTTRKSGIQSGLEVGQRYATNSDAKIGRRAGLELSPVRHKNVEMLKKNPMNQSEDDPADYDRIKKDIALRGILVPLIAKPDGTLISGHTRIQIARELGLETVPVQVIETEISLEDEKRAMVLDNINRRQYSKDKKIKILLDLYDKDISGMKRGGDRSKPSNGGLTRKIAMETGIPEKTLEKYFSLIRKQGGSRPKVREDKATLQKRRDYLLKKISEYKAEIVEINRKLGNKAT